MARKVSRKEVARRREGKQLHQDPSLGKKTTKSKKKKKKSKADKKKAKETQALSNNNHRKPKTKAKSGSPASLFGPLRKEAKVKQCSLPSPDQPVRASRAQPKSKLEKIQRHRKAFQMSPVATTTNYAGTKRNRPKFELKLPALNAHQTARTYANMPWFNCRDDFTPDTTEDGKDGISVDEDFESSHSKALPIMSKSAVVLPTHQFSPKALQKLSDELQAFAAYVRLRPHEYQAREWLIQHITDLAGTKFTKNKNVAIQCFGSFATPEVCTFYSDVDLALHGVVEAPKLTRFDSSDEQHVEDTTQQEEDRKQAKVQKWRVLLQELQELQDEEKKEYDTALGSRGVELHSFESDFPRKAYSPASIRSEGARHGEQSGSENHVTQSSIPLFELDVAGDEVEQTHLLSDEQVVSAADVNRSCCDGEETGCRVQEIESDDDSADKLENLMASGRGERIFSSVAEGDESPTAQIQGASSIETEDSSDNITVLDTDVGSDQSPVRKRARLSYDQPSHHSTLHVHDDNDLGVSFHSKAPRMQTQVMGPIGDTRKSVLTALRNLGAAMRKSRVIDNVELRRHARVPIITSTSRLGFEADIAIGGHSGTDTSLFASMQVEKYKRYVDCGKPWTELVGEVLTILRYYQFCSCDSLPEDSTSATGSGQTIYWRDWELQALCTFVASRE
jgi:hypothetical protein